MQLFSRRLLLALLPSTIAAQTRVSLTQVRAAAVKAPALLAITPDGQVNNVTVGAGLELVMLAATGAMEIRLAGPVLPTWASAIYAKDPNSTGWIPSPKPDGTIIKQSILVFVNGVKYTEEDADYIVAAMKQVHRELIG